MKNPLTIEGRWHVHGEKYPAHYGRLICKPSKGLRLQVKELRDEDIATVMSEGMKGTWNDEIQIIQGWDADNRPLRLFGCCDNGRNRKTGMQTHRFFVHRAVTGISSGTWHGLKVGVFG